MAFTVSVPGASPPGSLTVAMVELLDPAPAVRASGPPGVINGAVFSVLPEKQSPAAAVAGTLSGLRP
jgi:hypothetical protein